MELNFFRRSKIPVGVLVAFALMATAGSTKLTYGVMKVHALLRNDVTWGVSVLMSAIDVAIGVTAFWFSVALLLRHAVARKALIGLALIFLLLDANSIIGLLALGAGSGGVPSSVHAALNWASYLVVVWILTTQAVKDFVVK